MDVPAGASSARELCAAAVAPPAAAAQEELMGMVHAPGPIPGPAPPPPGEDPPRWPSHHRARRTRRGALAKAATGPDKAQTTDPAGSSGAAAPGPAPRLGWPGAAAVPSLAGQPP